MKATDIDSPFVLDASVTMSWCLPNEAREITRSTLRALDHVEAFVPSIWWFEVRNVLLANERRERISLNQTNDFLAMLERLPIRIEKELNEGPIFDLARRHQLSFYDAAYVALAQWQGRPLASLDRRMRNAAEQAGITLLF